MAPKSNVPIRICGSKSRSGCRACKQRHVKCDERQPTCVRCWKADRTCVYERPASQSPQHKPKTPPRGNEIVSLVAFERRVSDGLLGLGSEVSFYAPYEATEIASLKNFTLNLGKEFAGAFSDDVWCHTIPRVAHHEPAIWHALVAVSMLDTSTRLGPDGCSADFNASAAIRHYGRAMEELNKRLKSDVNSYCKDVVLLASILFAIVELSQSRIQSALRHISGGMKLLMAWDHEAQLNSKAGAGIYLDHTSLKPVFFALDSQAIQMGVVEFQDYFGLPAMTGELHIPASFATAQDAHLLLNHIFNRLSRWAYWVHPTIADGTGPRKKWMTAEERRLRSLFTEWDCAFNPLRRLLYPQPPILLLIIQRKVLEAFLMRFADGPSELEWDKYLPLFAEAAKYAEEYMLLTSTQNRLPTASSESDFGQPQEPRPILTVTMDIVLSLFLIAAKCRDSKVRRRALAMLKICNRREGIWDSGPCAQVAEKIILLEEAQATEDGFVPEGARIFQLDIQIDDEKQKVMIHKRCAREDENSQRIETVEEFLVT